MLYTGVVSQSVIEHELFILIIFVREIRLRDQRGKCEGGEEENAQTLHSRRVWRLPNTVRVTIWGLRLEI